MPSLLHLFVKEAAINLCGQKCILGQNRPRVVIDRYKSRFALASSHCDMVCFVFKPQLGCSCFLWLNCGLKNSGAPCYSEGFLSCQWPEITQMWYNQHGCYRMIFLEITQVQPLTQTTHGPGDYRGAQTPILDSVLNTQHLSELESGDLSKSDQPWPKPFPPGERAELCQLVSQEPAHTKHTCFSSRSQWRRIPS